MGQEGTALRSLTHGARKHTPRISAVGTIDSVGRAEVCMTPSLEPVLGAFHRGLLRGASLLVPGRQRAEWSQEWQSELWYVCRECMPAGGISWSGEREATAFCLGAYRDAFYLRRNAWQERSPLAAWRGSPALCILLLAAGLAASYGAALLLPGVRAERHLSRY